MKKIFVGAVFLLIFHNAHASTTACGPMSVADAKANIADDATLDLNDFDSVLPTLIQSSQVGDPEICMFLGVDINMFENLYRDAEQLEDAFAAAGMAQNDTSYIAYSSWERWPTWSDSVAELHQADMFLLVTERNFQPPFSKHVRAFRLFKTTQNS